jgi:hypothetical protein
MRRPRELQGDDPPVDPHLLHHDRLHNVITFHNASSTIHNTPLQRAGRRRAPQPAPPRSIFRFGWGFSTNQDFNGDIALIACFAASWTPAMIRRWNADPFGFLRPGNEVPALMGSTPPGTPPSTGSGVITFLIG